MYFLILAVLIFSQVAHPMRQTPPVDTPIPAPEQYYFSGQANGAHIVLSLDELHLSGKRAVQILGYLIGLADDHKLLHKPKMLERIPTQRTKKSQQASQFFLKGFLLASYAARAQWSLQKNKWDQIVVEALQTGNTHEDDRHGQPLFTIGTDPFLQLNPHRSPVQETDSKTHAEYLVGILSKAFYESGYTAGYSHASEELKEELSKEKNSAIAETPPATIPTSVPLQQSGGLSLSQTKALLGEFHLNRTALLGNNATNEEWNPIRDVYEGVLGQKSTNTDVSIAYDSQLGTYFISRQDDQPETLAQKVFKVGYHTAALRLKNCLSIRKDRLPSSLSQEQWQQVIKDFEPYGYTLSSDTKTCYAPARAVDVWNDIHHKNPELPNVVEASYICGHRMGSHIGVLKTLVAGCIGAGVGAAALYTCCKYGLITP